MFKVMLANLAMNTLGDIIRNRVMKDSVPDTMIEYSGDEEAFSKEMVSRNAKVIADPAARLWLYVDPKTSDTVGIRMRWPNRHYFYIVK